MSATYPHVSRRDHQRALHATQQSSTRTSRGLGGVFFLN